MYGIYRKEEDMRNSKYIVDPNGEHRAGCFGNAIRYGIGIPLILVLLWVLFTIVD